MRSAKIAWPYFQRMSCYLRVVLCLNKFIYFWRALSSPKYSLSSVSTVLSWFQWQSSPLWEFATREKSTFFKNFWWISVFNIEKNHKFCPGGSENRSILDLIWPFGSATDQDLSRWARFQVSFVAKSSENEFPMSECRNFSLHPCSGALPGSHKGQNYLQVEDV